MKPKFEIGDHVRHISSGYHGVIVGLWDEGGYTVRYEEDDSEEYYVLADDIEFINPKTAFLTRLQELLAVFDSTITFGIDLQNESSGIVLQVGTDRIFYPFKITETTDMVNNFGIGYCLPTGGNYPITAENVFDYDKD